MKLLVATPLPPLATGVADYSATLLAQLATAGGAKWEVEAFVADRASVSAVKDANGAIPYPVHPMDELEAEDGLPLYHLGNSEFHDFIYPHPVTRPGVVVLHDLVLHHARLNAQLQSPEVRAYREDLADTEKRRRAERRLDRYRAEIEAAYPQKGETIAEIAVRMGGGRLLYDYPLVEGVAGRSPLVLVHGTAARDDLRARCPGTRVERVRMGVPLPEPVSRQAARRRLGIGPGLLLASFGLVTPEKRIPTALRALERLVAAGVDADYVLVGGTVDHYDVRADAEALGLGERVQATGRVSDEDFWLYAFAADLCLNLRYPSAGETSATLLRLLACGRAVLVTDQCHVSDFPDGAVARVSLEGDEDGLYCDLMDLIRRPERRHHLEIGSRRFVEDEHRVEAMVSDYLAVLETFR